MDETEQRVEWLKCSRSFPYFVDTYVNIYDAVGGNWVPFKLWPSQVSTAIEMENNKLVMVLKARQLGITWLGISFLIWLMLFKPIATVLLFSRRETEAGYLMWRLKNVYNRLPEWMQSREVYVSNSLSFSLSNGSIAYAFPTTAGDSYTATAVLVDECDLVPDLSALMGAVKPTIDAGGHMLLVSRVDKKKPSSPFKNLFRAAMEGKNPWKPIFLPWTSHPKRTLEWYEDIKSEIFSRTGSIDELKEQYPSTPEEALEALQTDKRIPSKIIEACFQAAYVLEKGPLPGMIVYKRPEPGHKYIIGSDPAEGNPSSDDSASCVLDMANAEEVCKLVGKFEPTIFASYMESLSMLYNRARIMPERNNHGHVVIANLPPELVLKGLDGKPGWHTNIKSKAAMYSNVVKYFARGKTIVHDPVTKDQLLSIEGETLKAPDQMMDDHATAFGLATVGVGILPDKVSSQSYATKMYEKKPSRRQMIVMRMNGRHST